MRLVGLMLNLLELVVGPDELVNQNLSPLGVCEHGPQRGPDLSSCSPVQQNQI